MIAALVLDVFGSQRCTFAQGRMLKLEANGRPLQPVALEQRSRADADYIRALDGSIEFELPSEVRKLQIVFWHCQLDELQLSARLSFAPLP